MVYQFRLGARVKGVDAQTAGEELERIRERDGKIETETIVSEARPENAPLHPAFEWNDSVAADEYRLWQARALVRSVEIAPQGKDEEPTPKYVHVRATSEESGYYQSVEVAVQNPDEWASALSELGAKAVSAYKAFEVLERLSIKKTLKTRKLVKRAGAGLSQAKAAIEEIAK